MTKILIGIKSFIIFLIFVSYSTTYAIDCSRAQTVQEIAICSDPTLKAFDTYLSIAYSNVRNTTPDGIFSEVRRDQINWIRKRDRICGGDVQCLINETQSRTAELNAFAQQFASKTIQESQSINIDSINTNIENSQLVKLNPENIYELASNSVVVVMSFEESSDSISQGSGVVIQENTVATNCHVIGDHNATIILFKGEAYFAESVSGNESLDYCIVRTSNLPATSAQIGSFNTISPGQRVYSIGSPRGLELTIGEGLVSGLREEKFSPIPFIQTTAPISPGSSGGGLFDEYGRVIGITTFYLENSQNINFAVPIQISEFIRH